VAWLGGDKGQWTMTTKKLKKILKINENTARTILLKI
jgi:hypothetical protein